MNLHIKKIICDDIHNDLKAEAKKEGVSIATDKTQVLFGAYTEGVLIGFCSLVLFKHNKYGLLKSDYILRGYRRQGVYTKLNAARLEYAKEIGLKQLIASAYHDAANLHLKNGGVILKTYKEGYKISILL